MTIATTAGLASARVLICYSYSMTTAAQHFSQHFSQHDYVTTGPQLWRHVAVQHTCLVNDRLGMHRLADGGAGPAAGRSRWRRVREQNFFLHHAVTRQVVLYSRA